MAILGPVLTGLSPYLIARIFPVDYDGKPKGGNEIHAPFEQPNMEFSLNWQSAFEHAGPESNAPALTAMLQSGALQPLMNILSDSAMDSSNKLSDSMTSANNALDEFKGRTGITKLNSTQIFSGMAPVKLTANIVLRAYKDAKKEVDQPLNQLIQWALPQKLAKDGVLNEIAELVRSGSRDLKEYLKGLMPSQAPHLVGVQYKRRSFSRMVIESIADPLDSPITGDGYYASAIVPITFSTLTALDANDWAQEVTRRTAL